MKLFTTLLLVHAIAFSYSQTVATFEDLEIDDVGYLNGSDLSGGFSNGNIFLPNNFDVVYESWLGWAITNQTDTTTSGFGNQYSSIVGSGNEGSANYATSFSFGPNTIQFENEAMGQNPGGVFITNSTYAYLSMLDGDQFAKKFGGASGDDPDFFLLTIKGLVGGEETLDSIDFYLADYRFQDNTQDYILDEWIYIDLYGLGEVDGLSFTLSSSDNGQFGMNTPAFFCIDDIKTTDGLTANENFEKSGLKLYPNPVSDVLFITDYENWVNYEIHDLKGSKIAQGKLENQEGLELSALQQGQYIIGIWNDDIRAVDLFFKD